MPSSPSPSSSAGAFGVMLHWETLLTHDIEFGKYHLRENHWSEWV